jgi:hypothetical protein
MIPHCWSNVSAANQARTDRCESRLQLHSSREALDTADSDHCQTCQRSARSDSKDAYRRFKYARVFLGELSETA